MRSRGALIAAIGGITALLSYPLSARTKEKEDARILKIRQDVATITKQLMKATVTEKTVMGLSVEGGTLKTYEVVTTGAPTLKKIEMTYFGEMGRKVEEYYYRSSAKKAKAFFVFSRDMRYDEPLSGKVASTQENRFYFDGDTMIRWIDDKGRQRQSSEEEYKQHQDEMLRYSQQFACLRSISETEVNMSSLPSDFCQ